MCDIIKFMNVTRHQGHQALGNRSSGRCRVAMRPECIFSYKTARPPTKAAPSTPHAAVCNGTAAPFEVEVVVEFDSELDPCASPVAVDSLAFR